MIDLTGKAYLVTGGSRGIGAATARLLARAGASVGVSYRSRTVDAERVVEEIRQEGRGGAIAVAGDLTTLAANEQAVAATLKAFGRLDGFVANAGVWPVDGVAVSDMSLEQWRHTMAANLDAIFFGCRAATPRIEAGGTIVIVSSTAGQRGEAFHADYAATKGAVIAFVKSLAVELAPKLTVNCVAPGWVDTEMVAPALNRGERAGIEAAIPLKRVASAADIAGPILFLCSPLARHITGEVVNVNGGSVLCG